MVITLLNFFIDVASAITSSYYELQAFCIIFERGITFTTVLLLEVSRQKILHVKKKLNL